MWKQYGILFDGENVREIEDWELKKRKPQGWMFWGSFAGRRKGPSFFWEKAYGGINSDKYIYFILPLIEDFLRSHPQVIFQQDNAPSHRSKATTRALQDRGIEILKFPRYSPDLTPIENVWSWMKSYIEQFYDIQNLSLRELRAAIIEAWEAVPEDWLLQLAHSMPDRLRECIRRGGRLIDY